eukprot:Hpha_TRINITY_DN8868_c0_g1::TRINITY_DN8868_c0_g1_i1::g.141447::m.141447
MGNLFGRSAGGASTSASTEVLLQECCVGQDLVALRPRPGGWPLPESGRGSEGGASKGLVLDLRRGNVGMQECTLAPDPREVRPGWLPVVLWQIHPPPPADPTRGALAPLCSARLLREGELFRTHSALPARVE